MNHLPAGLSENDRSSERLEFFADNGTVYAMYHCKKQHYSQLPEHILMIFRKEMKRMPLRCDDAGITPDMEPMEALGLYLMHEYGDNDTVPDLETDGSTHREPCLSEVMRDYSLTRREVEMLTYLGQGKLLPEIARLMCIAYNTAEVHSNHIKEKIGAINHIDVARFAIHHHFVCA